MQFYLHVNYFFKMNQVKILTFAKGNFCESQKKLKNYLDALGIKNQKHLTDASLPESFLEKNKEIFSFNFV